MSDYDEALRKLEDAAAIMDEFLPDPDDAYDKLGAEMRDARLCFDRDAYERAEKVPHLGGGESSPQRDSPREEGTLKFYFSV